MYFHLKGANLLALASSSSFNFEMINCAAIAKMLSVGTHVWSKLAPYRATWQVFRFRFSRRTGVWFSLM